MAKSPFLYFVSTHLFRFHNMPSGYSRYLGNDSLVSFKQFVKRTQRIFKKRGLNFKTTTIIGIVDGDITPTILASDTLSITRARRSRSMVDTAVMGVNITFQQDHAVMSNGIVQITISNPQGDITGIQYKGINNLLEARNIESNRGYWDLTWSQPQSNIEEIGLSMERLTASSCKVIMDTQDQVELSCLRTWNFSLKGKTVPLNVDKRYILLRGSPGFYTYAIFEHLKEWPGFDLGYVRLAFKLSKDKFHYMAISDDRRRNMPLPNDRLPGRGEQLGYPEAVLLVNPIEPQFKGQVDDKYQYACELKDLRVHGWICMDPAVGFWQITPSNEFRVGGPIKPELTSHVGPTTLAMFSSTHYGGKEMIIKFGEREPWKKVFGPVFIYLNTVLDNEDPHKLWDDAKNQMSNQVQHWPYDFPASNDFQRVNQRGAINGRLLVQDRFINSSGSISAKGAYVGLAAPGDVGSWQTEGKKYQFWTEANEEGYFTIKNIVTGEYNLYAWVPGYIGDYKNSKIIKITSGANIDMGELVYEPPRHGPTLWEIGFPDRLAAEFYIPDPNPKYDNDFLRNSSNRYTPLLTTCEQKTYLVPYKHQINIDLNRFRQYGLWSRYAELYPEEDLVYKVGESDYKKDFFYAHVIRRLGKGIYKKTTWTIKFSLNNVSKNETYILRVALAAAEMAHFQVHVNTLNEPPLHSTHQIGGDNAVARHGIHGLYRLFNLEIPGTYLSRGENSIYLTQANNQSCFNHVMYDYIRLETP